MLHFVLSSVSFEELNKKAKGVWNKSMNQWVNESINQQINEPMHQWIKSSFRKKNVIIKIIKTYKQNMSCMINR